ncbi:PaaI family thioesterase [Nocardioides agariphilus]|uniref:PaaI family thioesterase n=1 Tax=Nocardioides agariphilus TaxID=433664 RepID=A0A930VIP2_9ACTN|nr:PaaI family thioesterase [Nocardioides agariphilus]MBF4766336.1 PaaI family thioesterase [Nocardioides agariphilus]
MTSTEATVRSRTVTWDDPMVTAAAGRGEVGLDFLQRMVAGELPGPPIASLLRMSLVSVSSGSAVFTLAPDESMYNPIGVVHGGIVCTLLDSALGCALHTTLPAGKGYTSVEIKVSYLKAVRSSSGRLTATGRVVRAGSRVGFTEGEVTDESGAVVATATSTLLVFDL